MARAYELSNEATSVIIGPTGGGKTESSVRRILRIARSQHPSPKDGIRKCRIVCVGPTYRDLWDKAIPSYWKVFPKSMGQWTGGKGDPATHIMDLNLVEMVNGKRVETSLHIEVWFRAKGSEQNLEDFVRGLECTAWWLQEMDQLDASILSLVSNRVGRYPEPEDRWDPEDPIHAAHIKAMGWKPAFKGVWGDSNMPVIDSWLDKLAFKLKGLGRGLFLQPPGLLDDGTVNPKAENLHNLRRIDPRTYAALAEGMLKAPDGNGQYDVDRLLKCKRMHDRRGRPVYDIFVETDVKVTGLTADPNQLLIIGADTGGTLKNAAVFMQPRRNGGVNCLAEISPRERQLTLTEFSHEILSILSMRFYTCRHVLLVIDPAAKAKMVDGIFHQDISYWQFLMAQTGLDTVPASTNDPGLRRTAGKRPMKEKNHLFIDADFCPDLMAALGGGYHFRKVGDAVSPEPAKNDYSHVAEAYEYGCLQIDGASIYYGEAGPKTTLPNGEAYDQGAIF